MNIEKFVRNAFATDDGNVILEDDSDFTAFENLKYSAEIPAPRNMGYPKDSKDPRILVVYANHEIAANVSVLVNIEANR